METLCGTIEFLGVFDEWLSRSEVKDQELQRLCTLVESISQSVGAFVTDLTPEEKVSVWKSNKVWSQVSQQLQACWKVIRRQTDLCAITGGPQLPQLQDEECPEGAPVISALRRSWVNTTRAMTNSAKEGLELLNSKLGSVGSVFKLPEDQLGVMKEASEELKRLLPLLQLAITSWTSSSKRKCSEAFPNQNGSRQVFLRSDTSADPARAASAGSLEDVKDDPMPVIMKFMSESPASTGVDLPPLTTQDLRSASSMSTASLDSTDGAEFRRFLFGRQEVKQVPKGFTLPRNGEAQPIMKFVSRDMFALEVPIVQAAVEDSMNCATLAFGGDDGGATLALGGPVETFTCTLKPLAAATGLATNGFHMRVSTSTRWRWFAKDSKVELNIGDVIALLLESPPDAVNPAPMRDLEASEARCILGVEFRPRP